MFLFVFLNLYLLDTLIPNHEQDGSTKQMTISYHEQLPIYALIMKNWKGGREKSRGGVCCLLLFVL